MGRCETCGVRLHQRGAVRHRDMDKDEKLLATRHLTDNDSGQGRTPEAGSKSFLAADSRTLLNSVRLADPYLLNKTPRCKTFAVNSKPNSW